MPVTRGTAITQADLDALATLANSIGAPMPTDFEFNYFSDDILPPTEVVGTISYGAGGYRAIGAKVLCQVYSYKDFGSRRHYSKLYATGHVTPDASGDFFTIEWNWTPPVSAVDGYIFTLLESGFSETGVSSGQARVFYGAWTEVTSLPFSDDYDSLWLSFVRAAGDGSHPNPVISWVQNAEFGASGATGGPWLRELNRIRGAAATYFALTPDWLVSGPWCVSVGSRLRYGSDATVYGEVEFWYAADDHSGYVEFDTVAEIGDTVGPFRLVNNFGDWTGHVFQGDLTFTLPTAHSASGRIAWTTAIPVSVGVTHALSVTSGAVTITAETWTVSGSTITVDFTLSLPSGVSNTRVDIDLNDAANAFLEVSDLRQHGLLSCDVLLATETVPPTSATALHPNSTALKATPSDLDDSLGPVTFNSGTYYPSFHVADDTSGVWVAKTRFIFGVHTYLDCDLPNYYLADSASSARGQAISSDGEVAVTPAVRARPSLWPVFRNTDFGTWKRNSPGAHPTPVPYYALDVFHFFAQAESAVAAGGVTSVQSVSVAASYEKLILSCSDATATIYVSTVSNEIDPDVPASYDVSGVGEVRLPDDFAYAGGGTVWYLAKNNSGSAQTLYLRRILCLKDLDGVYPGDEPVFFKTTSSGLADFEGYSYNLATSTPSGLGKTEIPRSGYCIFELQVARQPVANAAGIAVIPSTGEPALSVSVGVMHDVTFDAAGTFTAFDTVIIPADAASVAVTVFWPVLAGAPLAYQCTEAVDIMAYVNFQPLVLSHYHPDASGGVAGNARGQHNGAAIWPPGRLFPVGTGTSATIRWANSCQPSVAEAVSFQITADIYNDIEAILNLL